MRGDNLLKTDFPRVLLSYAIAVGIVVLCTMLNYFISPYIDTSNIIMIYLLAVVIVATWQNEYRGPSICTAVLSTLAFNYVFLEPPFAFSYAYANDLITLALMLTIAVITSYLTTNMRKQVVLSQAAKSQVEQEKFRNTLLLSISHDLRTPLTGIMGSASSLLQNKLSNDQMNQELLQNIYIESERLNRLFNNILQNTRLESGMIKLEKKPFAIEEVIGSALNKLKKKLDNRPVKINLPDHCPFVLMDNILIEQVLLNIIENAIKFTPPNTSLEIDATISSKDLTVAIADQGPGLKPEKLSAPFNKLGLGLSICETIVFLHGGRIWAKNRDKETGAIFYFCIPREEDSLNG